MAFKHGSKARVYVNGHDLTGYLRSFTSSGSRDSAETTTFGKTAKTYVPGLKDATLSAEGVYDGDPKAVDEVLSTALGQDQESLWTWFPQGDSAIGNVGYGFAAHATSYEVESPVDDVVSVSVEAQSKVGKERVQALHPIKEETANGQGTSLDGGASSTNGGVGYLHVTNLSGTNPTLDVTIQHSDDNGASDPWSALITFTQVTQANTAQRIEVSGTVKRYVRVTWAIGGTGSPKATFVAAFGRK